MAMHDVYWAMFFCGAISACVAFYVGWACRGVADEIRAHDRAMKGLGRAVNRRTH
jgi:hypothetical protein